MGYALFLDGKQASKEHSTKEAAAIEAFEHGFVVYAEGENVFIGGAEIREIKE